MEPRREEQKAPQPGAKQKPKRFRIVKLEERIAPAKGGGGTNGAKPTCYCTIATCTCGIHCSWHGCW